MHARILLSSIVCVFVCVYVCSMLVPVCMRFTIAPCSGHVTKIPLILLVFLLEQLKKCQEERLH